MGFLTMILFERLGLLLLLAFILTRIPGFRSLLDREMDAKTTVMHAIVFGLFGIAGTVAGVVVDEESIVNRLWVLSVGEDEMLVSSSLVAIVIAGLLGGPYVGLGAGVISGVFVYTLGGLGHVSNSLVNPLTGLLAGFTARFFFAGACDCTDEGALHRYFPTDFKNGIAFSICAGFRNDGVISR